jgi:hypothetical protein
MTGRMLAFMLASLTLIGRKPRGRLHLPRPGAVHGDLRLILTAHDLNSVRLGDGVTSSSGRRRQAESPPPGRTGTINSRPEPSLYQRDYFTD